MNIYELNHLYYHFDGDVVLSPKKLGLFASATEAKDAILYFRDQPGFCDEKNAFMIHAREVIGAVQSGIVYEALGYIHTPDYSMEHCVELGLFGAEEAANLALSSFGSMNPALCAAEGLETEQILNRWVLGKLSWAEGFSIYRFREA